MRRNPVHTDLKYRNKGTDKTWAFWCFCSTWGVSNLSEHIFRVDFLRNFFSNAHFKISESPGKRAQLRMLNETGELLMTLLTIVKVTALVVNRMYDSDRRSDFKASRAVSSSYINVADWQGCHPIPFSLRKNPIKALHRSWCISKSPLFM